MICSSLHNHCVLCDGVSTPEEMVKSAFEAGIKDFGFSSHAPFLEGDFGYALKDEDEYIARIRKAIKENELPINLYLGIEDDLLSNLKRREEYDYIIGSTHHIVKNGKNYAVDLSKAEQIECVKELFDGNALEFVREYYKNLLKVAKSKPDILGHFDLVAKYGFDGLTLDEKKYREIALDCVDECISLGSVFEINYGAIVRKTTSTPYPAPFIMERIAQKGGRVTASTDCHDAKRVSFGLKEANEYALSFGITEMVTLRAGKWTSEKIK